jgi:hypothetical protein
MKLGGARLIVAVLSVAALAGCTRTDQPEDPVWGKQPCEHCHMVVSDPRFAAQLVTRAGDRVHFDDVGCMAKYLIDREPEVAHLWVKSASGLWTDALKMHYSAGHQTPMGYGFVADAAGTLDFAAVKRAAAQTNMQAGAP